MTENNIMTDPDHGESAPRYGYLLDKISQLNGYGFYPFEKQLIRNKDLVDQSTIILNSTGTDPKSLDELKQKLKTLEESLTTMKNKKEGLVIEKQNFMQEYQNIDVKNTTLDNWVKTHPFKTWNYSNKINKIDVYYTSLGVIGARISYRNFDIAPIITGNIEEPSATMESVNFTDDEWLMQIQIRTSNMDLQGVTLCKNISFYTTKNLPGTPPKITIPSLTGTNVVENKTYSVNRDKKTWLEHKRIAEARGGTLVCFENQSEIENMFSQINSSINSVNSNYNINSLLGSDMVYIGLYHTNALIPSNFSGDRNKNGNWKWVDNTPYSSEKVKWHNGEPNNWGYNAKRPGSGENVANIYLSNKAINDINKNARLPAIYQKKITTTNTQTLRKIDEHVKSFTIKPLSVTYDTITSTDIATKLNAESAVDSTNQVTIRIEETGRILDTIITETDNAIAEINLNIEATKRNIIDMERLNTIGSEYINEMNNNDIFNEEEMSTNITNIVGTEFFSPYMSGMPIMREGNTNMGPYVDANNANRRNNSLITGSLLNELHSAQDIDKTNAISEFIIKRDNIFTNVLTDYMLNDEKKNDFEGVYDKIAQQSRDKMRKLEINTYYDKAYKEYINILKVIIFVCIILVPIIIANKNSMLPNSITNILVVTIIFLTIIYIIGKLIDMYMRDNKDFDKIRIPYDREAAILQKSGTITKKNNLLSSFTLTCIGEDCCPDPSSGMVYDPTKNRCVANETFADYFDRPIGGYLDATLNDYIDGSLDRLLGNSNNISIVQPFQPEISTMPSQIKRDLFNGTLNSSNSSEMVNN